MTEAEAREIVERYEALLLAVIGDAERRRFPCPLEIVGTDIFATQPDDVGTDSSWMPAMRRRALTEL